jgi:hypothetical protein
MTAHAGDALSHVYFKPPPGRDRARSNPISKRFLAGARDLIWPTAPLLDIGRVTGRRIRSGAICMGAMSHPGGLVRRLRLLLHADFAAAHEDCIKQ